MTAVPRDDGLVAEPPGARWFSHPRRRPWARGRLICFPHGGGSASAYRSWATRTPDDIELLAVQYPGRMQRIAEPPIDTMAPMADEITDAIVTDVPPPYALFGHSMGAAIAFEVALRLQQRGRPACQVTVSGRGGPARHRRGYRHLASDEALMSYLKVLGGTDALVFDSPGLWPIILPLLRSDFKLSETWEPDLHARVRSPLVAVTGDRDPEVSIDRVRAWELAAADAFALRVFEGGHFYLQRHEQAVVELALGDLSVAAQATFTPTQSLS